MNDVAPMAAGQRAVLQYLIELARSFKNASKKERRERMLGGHPSMPVIVETDAANAGLDVRLYDSTAGDFPENKVNRATKNILKHYNEHPLATQAVFVDRGYTDESFRSVRDADGMVIRDNEGKPIKRKMPRFNLVDDLIDKLVKGGIKRQEIAVVAGGVSAAKKEEIANMMNTGQIRVVIGQSGTLGTGVNAQAHMRAMHHLDAPWMPGLLEQRNGRGWRQGNDWNTVLEYRYITEGLDGRRWQVLAVKDRYIKMFLHADDNLEPHRWRRGEWGRVRDHR
jgi:hypothetical protein